jgi:MFS family permease
MVRSQTTIWPPLWIPSSRPGSGRPSSLLNVGLIRISGQIIGALVNAFSTSVGMYVGSRIILGFGGGMTKVVAPPLLQETAHPRLRPILASMYYALYYAGSILAAWLTFGTLHMSSTEWSWRLPSLFQVVGPILVLALTAWMPESPRFMVKQGKVDQALEVLAKYHASVFCWIPHTDSHC